MALGHKYFVKPSEKFETDGTAVARVNGRMIFFNPKHLFECDITKDRYDSKDSKMKQGSTSVGAQ
jgi:hypothetical protein